MRRLASCYLKDNGEPKNPAKAAEWYARAANLGDGLAMQQLAWLYLKGEGVERNRPLAIEWLKKAAYARTYSEPERAKLLQELMIDAAKLGERWAEVVTLLEETLAAVEQEETKAEGKLGARTASALVNVSWYALFAKQFDKVLATTDRALPLVPDMLAAIMNRAHALMFLGRGEEAIRIYREHKGRRLRQDAESVWEKIVLQDLDELEKAGLTCPLMANVREEMRTSH